MEDMNFASILNFVFTDGVDWVTLAVMIAMYNKKFKEIDYRFKINDIKHETYEEQFRRLEAELFRLRQT